MTMTLTNVTITPLVTIRARAFAGQPVREVQAIVYDDGSVAVYDESTFRWTTDHALTQAAQGRARALAAQMRAL